MYLLMMGSGAPPQDAAKYDGDQKCSPRRYLRMWPGNSWRGLRAETPLREPAGEAGQGGLGRVADEEGHVAGFAVELAELGGEVCADVTRDPLAAGQDLPGERAAPVLSHEDQMSMEAAGNVPSPVHVRVLLPAWCHRSALLWVS
jgi:hypothetical protein